MSEQPLVMLWGKFKGVPLDEIPNSYIKWLAENCNDETICKAADDELKFREQFDINIEE